MPPLRLTTTHPTMVYQATAVPPLHVLSHPNEPLGYPSSIVYKGISYARNENRMPRLPLCVIQRL